MSFVHRLVIFVPIKIKILWTYSNPDLIEPKHELITVHMVHDHILVCEN